MEADAAHRAGDADNAVGCDGEEEIEPETTRPRLAVASSAQPRGIPTASVVKRKGSPCQQQNNSQGGKRTKSSGPELPEDIWHSIHSLLPMRDAARASCVSHAFLHCWRWHPNLTLSEKTLGLSGRNFTNKADQIMKNHSGIGIKTFKLQHYGSRFYAIKLDNWLKIAVTPEIEELELSLPTVLQAQIYNFLCSLLFVGSAGNSIRNLQLAGCAFRPVAGLGCLTRLYLSNVHITGDELSELEVIENEAPNLCTVLIDTDIVHISIGDSLQVKHLEMYCAVDFNLVHHACSKLPTSMPKLETLSISSAGEMLITPSVPVKFLHLKHLDICLQVATGLFYPNYDYFSLVHFLDACPMLETFRLDVVQTSMMHRSVLEDSSHLREMPEHHHGNIKKVEIVGFCSAKSMVELTCHILENATSLECLTLDTISSVGWKDAAYRLSDHKYGKCSRIGRHMIAEADKALLAIERCVVGKVPSTVKLNVLKPCSRCHVLNDANHPML